jgi:hypothetical protein
MSDKDVESLSAVYLEASGGSLAEALRIALGDLLEIQAEAAFRTAALDQWVSRGYIQGKASEELSGQHREVWRQRFGQQSRR